MMKKIVTVLVCLIVSYNAHTQTEKIGINTTSPEETVHVIGDIILLESPDGTKKVMLRTGGASGELKSLGDLYLRAEGNEIILNHVPTDGNVAIGKTGPTERLDVGGAIRIGTTTNMSSEEGTVKFEAGDFQGYDGTEWQSFTDGGNSIWELALDTSTIVYDSGKVIVGSTATPQELDVTDNVTFRGELHMSSLAGANPTFKIVDNGSTFYMGPIRNGSDYYIQTTKDMIFRTSGNTYSNKLVIKNDGKVGIGDGVDPSTLSEALTVEGGINIGNTTETNPGSIKYTTADGFEGYDDGEWKSLSDGGSTQWEESTQGLFYTDGRIAIGTQVGIGNMLDVETYNNFNLAHFRNLGNLSSNHKGVTSSLEGNGTGNKIAGEFKSLNGSGDNTSLNLEASGEGTNKAIHAFVNNAKDEDRAAHFSEGRVQINDRLGVGGFVLDGSKVNVHNQGIDTILNGMTVYNNINTPSLVKGIDVGSVNKGAGDVIALDASSYGTSSSSGDIFGVKSLAEGPGSGDRYSMYAKTGNFNPGTSYAVYADLGDGPSPGYGVYSNTLHENHYAFYGKGKSYLSKNLHLGGSGYETSTSELSYDQTYGADFGNPIRDGEFLLNTIISPEAIDPGDSPTAFKDTIAIFGGESELIELHSRKLDSDGSSQKAIQIKAGEAGVKHGVVNMYNQHGTRTIKIDGQAGFGDHAHITLWDGENTTSRIQINSNYGGSGNARIITDELEIKGGSDLAEYFNIKDERNKVLPGYIVSIDPSNKGGLILSNSSFDKKVVGVISGANGIKTGFMMSQDGSIADGDFPVALTGRVYVYANNENGNIQPGDFLTTSSEPGIAMKVDDIQKSQGAILGKAMTEIDENGFVLLLVNLQ